MQQLILPTITHMTKFNQALKSRTNSECEHCNNRV